MATERGHHAIHKIIKFLMAFVGNQIDYKVNH